MIVHAAAHLFADGDLAGGLRNMWDVHRLMEENETKPDFMPRLAARAEHHGLQTAVVRALRIRVALFFGSDHLPASDRYFVRRLLARNGWGQATRPATRLGFYVRSHWLRMPPLMLARHLWVKARR
jgi:hypothetical protein